MLHAHCPIEGCNWSIQRDHRSNKAWDAEVTAHIKNKHLDIATKPIKETLKSLKTRQNLNHELIINGCDNVCDIFEKSCSRLAAMSQTDDCMEFMHFLENTEMTLGTRAIMANMNYTKYDMSHIKEQLQKTLHNMAPQIKEIKNNKKKDKHKLKYEQMIQNQLQLHLDHQYNHLLHQILHLL